MCLARNRELAFRMARDRAATRDSDRGAWVRRLRSRPGVPRRGILVRPDRRSGSNAARTGAGQAGGCDSRSGVWRRGLAAPQSAARACAPTWMPCRCPPGIWSTSIDTGRHGCRRTAISHSIWHPAADARTAATGARSRSTARNYHCRSARSVADEMLHLKKAFGAGPHLVCRRHLRAFSAMDTANLRTRWKSWDAQIPFKMQSRCDLMTRDTVAALKRAGCAEVWMGAESGSQKILDAMDKGIRVEADLRSARESAAAWNSRLLLSSVRLSGRRMERDRSDHPHGSRDRAGRHRHLGFVSAAGNQVSSDRVHARLGRERTGPTAPIWR